MLTWLPRVTAQHVPACTCVSVSYSGQRRAQLLPGRPLSCCWVSWTRWAAYAAPVPSLTHQPALNGCSCAATMRGAARARHTLWRSAGDVVSRLCESSTRACRACAATGGYVMCAQSCPLLCVPDTAHARAKHSGSAVFMSCVQQSLTASGQQCMAWSPVLTCGLRAGVRACAGCGRSAPGARHEPCATTMACGSAVPSHPPFEDEKLQSRVRRLLTCLYVEAACVHVTAHSARRAQG